MNDALEYDSAKILIIVENKSQAEALIEELEFCLDMSKWTNYKNFCLDNKQNNQRVILYMMNGNSLSEMAQHLSGLMSTHIWFASNCTEAHLEWAKSRVRTASYKGKLKVEIL